MCPQIQVRESRIEDVPLLYQLITEMSVFERLPLTITEAQLSHDGYGAAPHFHAFIAFAGDEPAGYALTHGCYTDFEGRGLFLESFYVREPFRGAGVADRLLSEVVGLAREQRSFGIVLNILRWNARAVRFFQKAGAAELGDRAIYVIPAVPDSGA